jgi:hypothetical protein
MLLWIFFYKNIFVEEPSVGFHLGENFWKQSNKVKVEENVMLDAPCSLEEIREAVFLLLSRRGPRPRWVAFPILSKVLEGNSKT